jgi:hypothetical protein
MFRRGQNTWHRIRAIGRERPQMNVLGGKADQNLGSLPPKLRVLSAAFAVESGLVTRRPFSNLARMVG